MRCVLALCFSLASAVAQPADLVLRNGKIVTMNPARPQRRSHRGARRPHHSARERPRRRRVDRPQTRTIDLHGMLAIPGFIEGHGHFTGIGEFRHGPGLARGPPWDDIVAQVARAAAQARPGEWIVGRGWHQSKWDRPPEPNVEGFPLHESLDQVGAPQPGPAHPRQRPRRIRQRQSAPGAGITASHAQPRRAERS